MVKRPGVSIILPTYNSDDTLQRSLDSIVRQNYPFYETIVVDNYSVDSTAEMAGKFGATIVFHKGNAASAKNVGIMTSSDPYVLLLDSDQIVSRSLIDECVRICEELEVGVINIPETFVGIGFWSSRSADWKNLYFLHARENCTDKNVLGYAPRFFAKKYIEAAGLFNEELYWGEDYELYLRLKKMNIEESWCKSRIYHYEPKSLVKILRKNYYYGRFMNRLKFPDASLAGRSLLARKTYSTAKAVPKTHSKSVLSCIGIYALLGFRILATTLGSLQAQSAKT
jgi:glycosyltransferase involved in cell wall biosynthesis